MSDFTNASSALSWILAEAPARAVVNTCSNLSLNFAVYYFLFKTEAGQRIFAGRRLHAHVHTSTQILREIRQALLPEVLLSFVTLFTLASHQPGPLRSWFHIRWGWSWAELPRIALETFVLLAVYEVYFYFLHRVLHDRRLFKGIHSVHHESLHPTPLAGTSMDIREALALFAFYLAMVFCPLHIATITIVSAIIKSLSIIHHSGHEFFPLWWRRSPVLKHFNSAMFHQLHHSGSFQRNFGFLTSFLDRAFGTVDPRYTDYLNQ